MGGGCASSHEDEGTLNEGGPDEESHSGEGESDVDVVEEEEGRKRPQHVEGKKEGPDAEVEAAEARGAEEDGTEEEGADGDEDGGRDDERREGGGGVGERREQVLDLGEVGERPDVEAQVHELKTEEEIARDGVRDFGEFVGGGEDVEGVAGCEGTWLVEDRSACGTRGWDTMADAFDGCDETVAAAGEGLDEAGAGGGVAEGFADAIDGRVDTVLGVDIDPVGPEGVGDLVAGEEFAGAVEEETQNLEGLGVEAEANALAAELAGGGVGFVGSEAVATRGGCIGIGHLLGDKCSRWGWFFRR